MNTCKRLSAAFSDYVENVMLPEQQRAMEAHLSVCADCHAAITRLQTLRSSLAQLSQMQAQPDFEAILRARIRREGRRTALPVWRTRRLSLLLPRVAVFAAATLLLVLFVNLLRQQHPGVEPTAKIFPISEIQLATTRAALPVLPLTAQILYTLDKFSPRQWPPAPKQKEALGNAVPDSLSLRFEQLPHGPQNSRASLFSL